MRFIHVGVGGFGQQWVRVLKQSRLAKVVGLVDISATALAAACDVGQLDKRLCFGSLADALQAVEADAVVVSTPPALHRRDVVAAMRAGLDVISEKPMSDTLANCKAMVAAAGETRRTYAVSQNYRYSPAMWTLGKLVQSGKLGAVGQVKLDFYMGVDFGGGFRHSMPYPLIIDMSIHHVDLIRFITGLDAERVRADAWNPPWSNYAGDCSSTALFTMSTGARVLYNGSWCAKGSFCDWNGNWQIECERGTVSYERGVITVRKVPKGYAEISQRIVPLQSPPRVSQAFVLHDFMQAVKAGRRPLTDARDNLKSVAMIFATVKSMQQGREIQIMDKRMRELLT
ncbi:MAG: Gfo/Idh/MocA family oxidoreductase [Verrucomicrobia bacterium]|nr:Gfo/Idh/MocA family oxidoreductase [Verrucomicrobiota bacterium]